MINFGQQIANEEDMKLAQLKHQAQVTRRAAEKAAYEYFCECPVGPERIHAHETYQNIRLAPMRSSSKLMMIDDSKEI